MFWQKSYRLEWYLIIWHYLNLYVYSISFIAGHFLLWKLTGAKFNFESMFQQERNPTFTLFPPYLYILYTFQSIVHSVNTVLELSLFPFFFREPSIFLQSDWLKSQSFPFEFDGMVYQQIVGIPMGTNCAPLIADLFLYCYERDFMSDLQKSKRHDLIDMFNDTSRYLDDIFTIDNPEFEKYIPDIYPAELQLNKANTSDKETSFLDLNIKVIGSDIHTSVYDKRDDFGFPIVNFPWLSGDVPRLPSYGIYISQLVRFARCCTSVLGFHSKNLQITSKLLTQGYRYHKLRKTFGKFFRSYSELLSKFGDISFQEYVFKGISHPVFYGDLVYKLRRVKDTPNFISSGSKIVKRLRRRQYDPSIIETTIGLVLGPCTALCRLFLKHCTLTNKAVGTIWRALSKPPQRRQGPDLRPLWLLVGTPSAIRPELAFSRAEHSLPYSDVTIYIFAILYLSSMPYV